MTEVLVSLRPRADGAPADLPEARDPGVPRLPQYLTVFATWACNLRCRQCWLYGDSADRNDWFDDVRRDRFSLEMWQRLIAELEPHVAEPHISLMGGEPLLHPRINDLIVHAKQRIPGCVIDMSTNGTLLPRRATGLVETGIDIVYISLDGPTADVNDPIRGVRSHDKVLAGIGAIQDAIAATGRGPDLALNFTLTGMNYAALPDMVRLTEELGIGELTVDLSMYFTEEEGEASRPAFDPIIGRPFTSWAGYCNEHQHVDVDQQRFREVLDEAVDASPHVDVLVAPVRYSNASKSRYFSDAWVDTVEETTCPKLWAQTTILPNGDVISCTPFADTVMGSIAEASLESVWTGPTYARLRRLIAEQLQPVCYRCCELSLDIGVDPNLYDAPAPPATAAPAVPPDGDPAG